MDSSSAMHHGLGDSNMLERIDALFACGAGEHVNIPQIVVVGDQSSGKSSVLSGLIRKDLPRDSGLCTRFATKIVFRRSKETGIRATIIPDDNAEPEHRVDVAAWGELKVDSFDDFTFTDVMKEVHKVIGVADVYETPDNRYKPTFSGDVLQLEISGPDEEHLSVIDIPGLFRDPTPGLTTKEDIVFVNDMVERYMSNPRSVMLTVVPANVDVATQEVLQLASEMDPDGHRTLGVLTKPDLVDKGAENRIVDLVEGRARQIKLGWHVLRNPGQNDLSNPKFDRQREEATFFGNIRPWNTLDSENVGIEALRHRLKDILSRLVKKEFNNVRVEVQKKLTVAEQTLNSLGPERNTRAAQAAHLTEISTKFQHLVDLALSAKFGTNALFEEHQVLRIAPAVVQRMNQFDKELAQFGHKFSFNEPESHQDFTYDLDMSKKKKKQGYHVVPLVNKLPLSDLCVRSQTECDDLDDLLFPQTWLQPPSKTSSNEWLEQLHKCSRGFELGTFDPAIIASAMRMQTANWRPISLGFVSDVAVIIHTFTRTALACLCPDERLQDELYGFLLNDLKARHEKAIKQLEFILEVELQGTPLTQSNYFIDKLEESRQSRYIANIRDVAIQDEHHGAIVKLAELSVRHPMSNDQYLVRDIHDILHSYYEFARKRFTDNVCKQAADYFLLTGPDTPLRIFSPVFVSRMTDEHLEQIAKEEPQIHKQRERLMGDIESLRKAKQALA